MIIGIPVYQGVDLLDVTGPYEVFKWAAPDVEVRLLASSLTVPIVTRDGFRFLGTHLFSETASLDVLWVPGGEPDMLELMMKRKDGGIFLDFLCRMGSHAEWICSVCEGAMLLAAAGLLDGYSATTHWRFLPCLKKFKNIRVAVDFPRYVHDRNRLTGGGISSGLDESLQLIRLLKGDEIAREVQRTLQYFPEPPFPNDLAVPEQCDFFPHIGSMNA